jgi:hypothetical protein
VEPVMSFFKKLFGGGKASDLAAEAAGATVEYKGFLITPKPYKAGSEYQTAGVISKDIDGLRKEHSYIRAERHPSYDTALDYSLMKGKQIVDQMGDRVFI